MGKHPDYGVQLFADLYRELVNEPRPPAAPLPPQELTEDGRSARPEDIAMREAYKQALDTYGKARVTYEEAANGGPMSRSACRVALKETVTTEAKAIEVLETAFKVVVEYDDEEYRNKFFLLVERFLQKFSLRYDLRRPFTLHPTLPGVFAGLVRELKSYTDREPDLHPLMLDFEEALRDLRSDRSPNRIKTCIQKQMNLLEAMGQLCPGVTSNTLGAICNQVRTWPHVKVKEAIINLYHFASDYPGIRHAGTPANRIREIEMRDLVAMTVLLAGFSPYLRDGIDAEIVYRGG